MNMDCTDDSLDEKRFTRWLERLQKSIKVKFKPELGHIFCGWMRRDELVCVAEFFRFFGIIFQILSFFSCF
jgi:hypothetical protein